MLHEFHPASSAAVAALKHKQIRQIRPPRTRCVPLEATRCSAELLLSLLTVQPCSAATKVSFWQLMKSKRKRLLRFGPTGARPPKVISDSLSAGL